jgi:hypothetical protein
LIRGKTRRFAINVLLEKGFTRQTLGKIGSPRCRGTRPWCVFSFLAQQIRKMASMEEDGWSVAMARLYPLQKARKKE